MPKKTKFSIPNFQFSILFTTFVPTTQPEGEVIVNNGGNLRIKANETILKDNVEVKLGGTLIISK